MHSHHSSLRISLALLALLLSGLLAQRTFAADSADASANTALKAANALYDGIREEKLDNGLRVYLKPIAGSPVVTTMVAYRVGSADEDLDNTGLSHYLEHLMFKGTDKLKPGDIDRMTQINGGQNNAYTTNDYTIFHFDFAADRWDIALGIEADRMQNLRVDEAHEFQQEKGAVISELERDEDEPWDLEQKTILPLLFGPRKSLRPSGHRPAQACPRRDRGDHQGPLRQMVSPEQRVAGDLRRLRPREGDGAGERAVRPDSIRRIAAAQTERAHRA